MNAVLYLRFSSAPDEITIKTLSILTEPFACDHNKNVVIVNEQNQENRLFVWIEVPDTGDEELSSKMFKRFLAFLPGMGGMQMNIDSGTDNHSQHPEITITTKEAVDVAYHFCKSHDEQNWYNLYQLLTKQIDVKLKLLKNTNVGLETKDVVDFVADQYERHNGMNTEHQLGRAYIEWNDIGIKFVCNAMVEREAEFTNLKTLSITTYTFWMRKIDGKLKIYRFIEDEKYVAFLKTRRSPGVLEN